MNEQTAGGLARARRADSGARRLGPRRSSRALILAGLLLAAFLAGGFWRGRGVERGARLLELALILAVAVLAILLVRARRRFIRCLEVSPCPILLLKADGGIQLANRRAEELLGALPGGLVGESVGRWIAARSSGYFASECQFALEDHASESCRSLELNLRPHRGEEIPATITLTPTQTARGTVLHATLVVRRASDEAPDESGAAEARVEAILNACGEAIVEVDSAGLIQAWSAGAEDLYGRSESEALGLPVAGLVPPDRRGELSRIIDGVTKGRDVKQLACEHLTKSGVRRHVLVSARALPRLSTGAMGEPGGVVLAMRDATEIKRMEILSGEMQRAIECMLPGYARVDANGCVVDSNPALGGILGVDQVRVAPGVTWTQFFPSAAHSRLDSTFACMLLKGQAETNIDRFTILLLSSHAPSAEFQGHHLFVGSRALS